MIRNYVTWFAECKPCGWRGPMRYSEFAAKQDEADHQERRHGED